MVDSRRVTQMLTITTAGALLAACGVGPDWTEPRVYPYLLQGTRSYHDLAYPVDLDGDGNDEVVSTYRPTLNPTRPSLEAVMVLSAQSRGTVQANYDAHLLAPHYLDVDGDGALEILVPLVRNDSLFLSVLDHRAQKQNLIFLASGRPRIEPEGAIPWDPTVIQFFLEDADADGAPDLITVLNTAYARLPRGVLAHRLADGRLVGQLIIGSAVASSLVDDFDGDGDREVILRCLATNNGALAGGFDDGREYMHVVEVRNGPKLSFSKAVGEGQMFELWPGERLANGKRSVVALTGGLWDDPRRTGPQLSILEPGSWRATRSRLLAPHFRGAAVSNLDRTPGLDLAVFSDSTDVWILDRELEVKQRLRPTNYVGRVSVVPDVDRDGLANFLLGTKGGFALLDHDLRPVTLAQFDSLNWFGEGVIRLLRRDVDPQFLVRTRGRTEFVRLVRNRYYLLHRYSKPVTLGATALLLPTLGVGALRVARRNRRLRSVQRLALDSAPFGVLLLRSNGGAEWMNETLRTWLSWRTQRPADAPKVDDALAAAPDLLAFCHDLLSLDPPRHRDGKGRLTIDNHSADMEFCADPLTEGGSGWIVRVEDGRDAGNERDQRTWSLMAQRIAHDLKNPLTTMLLTLRRMRIEYRRQAPDAAIVLDEYSQRLEDRIDHLRRMTANFLKLMQVDDAARERIALDPFLSERAATLRTNLPPDIELHTKGDADGLAVSVDREQMESVLDNLVLNAINAMPAGGDVTIASRFVARVRLPGTEVVTDYALIEVRDTGVGIPAESLPHVFEPGFSTTPHGSGLGLVIARKIVTDHDGLLSIESEPGVGTLVSIHLPIATDGDSPPDPARGPRTREGIVA